MHSKLKPCPFCGREQPQDSKDDGNVPYEFGMSRSCKFCSAAVNLGWNTRPIEDALTARIAELEHRNKVLEDACEMLRKENGRLTQRLDFWKGLSTNGRNE